jgi:tryptophan synthase beta subunit
MTQKTSTKFGIYGSQFVPESLVPAIEEFATGDLGAGKDDSVVIRFEA